MPNCRRPGTRKGHCRWYAASSSTRGRPELPGLSLEDSERLGAAGGVNELERLLSLMKVIFPVHSHPLTHPKISRVSTAAPAAQSNTRVHARSPSAAVMPCLRRNDGDSP